nr:8047_t:CDS:2 [Entrophospora candida]
MSTTVFNIILNFMKDEPVKHITAGSIIYKVTEDDQTITKEDLFKLFKLMIDAIQTMKNIAGGDSEHFKKISNIHLESEQVPLDGNMIKKNIRYLQGKLSSDSSSLSLELYQNVNKIPITNLTWKDPLASQVVSEDSIIVENLSPKQNEKYMVFVKLTHDGEWKEMDKTLVDVTGGGGILDVLADVWVNLPFGPELMKTQSEGIAERQSITNAGREGKLFELVFGKCSCLLCSDIKKKEDKIKLWRETNDGMFWVQQPEKGQFGTEIQLNVLIRDNLDIHQYYHLKKTQIHIQRSEQALSTLPEFVELLLNLRYSQVRCVVLKKSTTVSSLPREEIHNEQNKKRKKRSKKKSGSIKHRSSYF